MQHAVLKLVDAFNQGWWHPAVMQEINRIASILNVETNEVWQGLCRTALTLARDPARDHQVDQPARWLPMLPGAWPKTSDAPLSQVVPPSESADPGILTQRMQALHLAAKNAAAPKDIMALTVRAIVEGLGMKRVVFNLLTPGKPELRARYVLGFPQQHPLRNQIIPLDDVRLFVRLLEKPQSIWFNPVTAQQFSSLLPPDFSQLYPATHFCAMSIFAGEKPLGLVFADCDEAPLTEHHYQHFKQICLLTTRALTQSANR
jgi:hypothetical protein